MTDHIRRMLRAFAPPPAESHNIHAPVEGENFVRQPSGRVVLVPPELVDRGINAFYQMLSDAEGREWDGRLAVRC